MPQLTEHASMPEMISILNIIHSYYRRLVSQRNCRRHLC